MAVILWLFFVLLNGKLSVEIALLGAVVAALGVGFACMALDWSWRRELRLLALVPRLIGYGGYLFVQIVKANLATLRRVYARRAVEPAIVNVHTKLGRRWQRVLLSNSITLTPGTITLELAGDELTVHCLDQSDADGHPDPDMERRIGRLEGRG